VTPLAGLRVNSVEFQMVAEVPCFHSSRNTCLTGLV
jgi:hypothetical protein